MFWACGCLGERPRGDCGACRDDRSHLRGGWGRLASWEGMLGRAGGGGGAIVFTKGVVLGGAWGGGAVGFDAGTTAFLDSVGARACSGGRDRVVVACRRGHIFRLSLLVLTLYTPVCVCSIPFPGRRFCCVGDMLFLFVVVYALTCFGGEMGLAAAFSVVLVTVRVRVFVRVVCYSVYDKCRCDCRETLVVDGVAVSLLFAVLSVYTCVDGVSVLLSSLVVTSCAVYALVASRPFLCDCLPLIVVVCAVVPLLKESLRDGVDDLLGDDGLLGRRRRVLLGHLRVGERRLFTFTRLLDRGGPRRGAGSLLDVVKRRSGRGLFATLTTRRGGRGDGLSAVEEVCPCLSPSRLGVYHLVLRSGAIDRVYRLLRQDDKGVADRQTGVHTGLKLGGDSGLGRTLRRHVELCRRRRQRRRFSTVH